MNTETETGINATKIFGDKYGKNLMGIAKKKKQGTNSAKTTDKNIVENSAEATGNLIGNKIADKITSLKQKIKKKKMKQMKKKRFIFHQKR